jgi:ribonuclease P protein component
VAKELQASKVMRRKYRLRANADFQRIRREGRTLVHPLLVIATLPNDLDHSRFGFAVGRRLGKAVTRNRIKRRMREVVRARIQGGEIAAGWDVVFIARHPMREATFHQVDETIDLMLRRAGLVGEAT